MSGCRLAESGTSALKGKLAKTGRDVRLCHNWPVTDVSQEDVERGYREAKP